MQGAEVLSTGATEDKEARENEAVLLAVNLAKRASVYALIHDNTELHDQLRVSKSALKRRPDMLTLAKLRDLHTRMGLIVDELADYGVLPADVEALGAAIDRYEEIVARPRVLITERKGYNQEAIPAILADLRDTLYKMDSLTNVFGAAADVPFVREYKDARIIVDLGSRKSPTGEEPAPITPE